ncbi:mitochondrial 2-oxoglutarate/malate carrier protein [Diabrotica virgifera virgifera]|uniref:Mitochondrial 2-oxoglutarate/malate carrier protein n=1 Tax=Diabrotica virgifera virgifera TaxID=50390 RepID=A0A6P7G7L4_DIAVI|nr:mitochondrial 2-oxoglutarate/malate carrier protein [Diabrotica virgifera virgifera]
MSEQKTIPNVLKFVFGASAGMGATCFVQPLDLVKNRMQLSGVGGKPKEYRSTLHAIQVIVQKEGVFSLYNGLSAGLLRQLTYTGTRLGVYTYLLDNFKSADGTPPGFVGKLLMGMVAGGCGAFVGTPAEVSLIRMTADGRLPLEERRNYKNVGDALVRIYREEGLVTLWRGAIPTMGRAVAVNAAQLSTYSQAKQLIVEYVHMRDGIPLHFVSSMISGLITTIVSMPLDIGKTRLQNMKTVNGVPEYKGLVDVLGRVVRNEGLFALWKGFLPYYLRLGPHTVLTFVFLEQMNAAYYKYVLGEKGSRGGL